MYFSKIFQRALLLSLPCILFSAEEKKASTPPTPTQKKSTSTYALEKKKPQKQYNPSEIQIGGTYSYCWLNPKSYPDTKGNLGGIQAIYNYRPADSIYAGLAFTWREGNTSGNGIRHSLLEFDVQERLGFSIFRSENMTRFSLFSGVGYRYYSEKRTRKHNKVTYNYNDIYIPVGFLLDSDVNSSLSLGLNFQWMPQVFPTVTIVPLKGASWTLEKQINNFLVEFPINVLFQSCNLSLHLVPFFELWNDGHTTAKTTTGLSLNVPRIQYLFVGINVNLGMDF